MKSWKKRITLPLALLFCSSLALTACGEESPTDDGGLLSHTHTFSDEWTSDENAHWHAATCDHTSETKDTAEHIDADNDGVCDVCLYETMHTDGGNTDGGDTDDGNEDEYDYKQFSYDPNNTEDAPGTAYNRYDGVEGYYQIQLAAGTTRYYSFAVSQSGTYALTTLQQKDGFSITRVDASAHYVPDTGYPATLQEDGTWISEVVCSDSYFNAEWRATYKITSNINDVITVCFARIGDAPREPQYITTSITPQEIVGKAQDAAADQMPVAVPWLTSDNPTYFYDEDYEMTFYDIATGEEKTAKGFYRYGVEGDESAPVIWLAITSNPPRLFEGESFSVLTAASLRLYTHSDPDTGDYYFNNYVDFIMNNGGIIDQITGLPKAGDPTKICYTNAANGDGLFPVNRELYEFLQYFMSANPPFGDDNTNIAKENYWLAPCYYYEDRIPGTEGYPIVLTEGENTVSASMTDTYYRIESDTEKKVTIEGAAKLILYLDQINYGGEGDGFSITVTVPEGGITFVLKSATKGEYAVTVRDATEETEE